jgi:murein DD-endopeptidase MepM/ murein hydrolase activator NlpD
VECAILEKSMKNINGFRRELGEFAGDWRNFIFRRGYQAFSQFEKVKDFIAQSLYRQRGRFARPFVHTAMGGLITMAVTLAPVLASSFPGVEKESPGEVISSTQVLEVQSTDTTTQISDKVRDQVIEYTVQPGDTVSEIADKFGISADTIRWENNLASLNSIKPGQVLRILPVSGVRHKVTRGETIYSIAKKYDANPQAVVDFPFNTFTDDETFALAVGQDLIVPDGKKPNEVLWSPTRYVAQNTPNAGSVSAIGTFIWPIGGRITQRFTWYHKGLDIATAFGTPILAADSGVVMVAGWPDNSGYGNRVVIDHGNGYQTWYGHMSKVLVSVGQTVSRGSQIGLEGSTGRSTGPHCHFEIRKNGVPVNPLDYLK